MHVNNLVKHKLINLHSLLEAIIEYLHRVLQLSSIIFFNHCYDAVCNSTHGLFTRHIFIRQMSNLISNVVFKTFFNICIICQ